MVVTRLLLLAFSLVAVAVQASAFSLSCESVEKGWPVLELEAIASNDGTRLSSFRAYIEIEADMAVEFSQDDVKSFSTRKDIALSFTKGAPRDQVQVSVNLKRVGELELAGTFVVRTGKIMRDGRILCSGG